MAEPSGVSSMQPAEDWIAITASDTVSIATACKKGWRPRSIWVGGAGVIAAVSEAGNVENFTVAAGSVLPIRPLRINSTNTTATELKALY